MTHPTSLAHEHALENAQVMLDVCRQEYERAGLCDAAQTLSGFDVSTLAAAQLARLFIANLPAVNGATRDVRDGSVQALNSAIKYLREPAFRRAG